MKPHPNDRLHELVRQCGPEVILRAASSCDGHTIFLPKLFVDAGLPDDVVAHLTRDHRSDGSPKGTIFVDGRPAATLRGVYGPDLLRFLAAALDLEYRDAMGRGFEAQNIQAALRQRFAPPVGPAGVKT